MSANLRIPIKSQTFQSIIIKHESSLLPQRYKIIPCHASLSGIISANVYPVSMLPAWPFLTLHSPPTLILHSSLITLPSGKEPPRRPAPPEEVRLSCEDPIAQSTCQPKREPPILHSSLFTHRSSLFILPPSLKIVLPASPARCLPSGSSRCPSRTSPSPGPRASTA